MLERPPRASGRAETIVANLPPGCACMVCPRAEAASIRSYPAGPSAGARQPPGPPKDPSPREAVHPPPAEFGHPGISPSTHLIMTMSHFFVNSEVADRRSRSIRGRGHLRDRRGAQWESLDGLHRRQRARDFQPTPSRVDSQHRAPDAGCGATLRRAQFSRACAASSRPIRRTVRLG